MSEPPDLDALARRYLDLWQEQVAAAAADPTLSDLFSRTMQLMAAGGPMGLMALWTQTPPSQTASAPEHAHGGTQGQRNPASDRQPAPQAAPGPAPAGAASERGGDDLGQRDRRLASMEERLARIEARLAVAQGSAGTGTSAARTGRKRRS
jgi:hypothetical protein